MCRPQFKNLLVFEATAEGVCMLLSADSLGGSRDSLGGSLRSATPRQVWGVNLSEFRKTEKAGNFFTKRFHNH